MFLPITSSSSGEWRGGMALGHRTIHPPPRSLHCGDMDSRESLPCPGVEQGGTQSVEKPPTHEKTCGCPYRSPAQGDPARLGRDWLPMMSVTPPASLKKRRETVHVV